MAEKMKIAILGPGAMGCLFAARLQRAGHEVTLLDHIEARARRMGRQGITVESADGEFNIQVPCTTKTTGKWDLIIVLTKAHTTAGLLLPPDAPVLTLQNGLGNVEKLCELVGSARVLAGTSSEAVTTLAEGHVRHVAQGLTQFGAWTSCPYEPALEALQSAGFNAKLADAPGQAIWEKVAINAGINPLSALMGVPNGRLLENTETRQLLRSLVVEAAKVASTEGYRFNFSLVEHAEEVCAQTSENISSMLQDVRAKRRTEIEAISGEIIKRAQMASLPVPRTIVVYQLLRGLESLR